jgi:hypothetical protein
MREKVGCPGTGRDDESLGSNDALLRSHAKRPLVRIPPMNARPRPQVSATLYSERCVASYTALYGQHPPIALEDPAESLRDPKAWETSLYLPSGERLDD